MPAEGVFVDMLCVGKGQFGTNLRWQQMRDFVLFASLIVQIDVSLQKTEDGPLVLRLALVQLLQRNYQPCFVGERGPRMVQVVTVAA